MLQYRVKKEMDRQTDDVELIDIINVLYKWKKTIILGTLFCIVVAGVGSYILPNVYRIATVLEIGYIELRDGSMNQIENPVALVEKIKGKMYDEEIREILHFNSKNFPKLKIVNPRNTDLVKISIESSDRDRAVAILKALRDVILNDHSEILEIEKIMIKNDIQVIENSIKLINQEKETVEQQLKLIQESKEQLTKQMEEVVLRISELDQDNANNSKINNPDGTLRLLLFQLQESSKLNLREEMTLKSEINLKNNGLMNLNLNKEKLKVQLQKMRGTKVIKKIHYPDSPIRPKKGLNVVLAGVVGLFVFIFISFLLEYFSGIRKSELKEVNGARQ